MKAITSSIILLSTLVACSQTEGSQGLESEGITSDQKTKEYEVVKSESEWKAELNDQEYFVIRKKGTERAGTGDLLHNKKEGVYICRACGQELFDSSTKFESGTGWPSFYKAIEGKVEEDVDQTYGMIRTEILCDRCGGHLGHVFPDGPEPTGLRYCVNSVSLDFQEKVEK